METLSKAQEIVTEAISKPDTAVKALSEVLKLCAQSHQDYVELDNTVQNLTLSNETAQSTMNALRMQNTQLLLNQPKATTTTQTQSTSKDTNGEEDELTAPSIADVAKAISGGITNGSNESNN